MKPEKKKMDRDLKEIRREIREWIRLDYIVPKDIPDIELYMDQVVNFMDSHLYHNKRGDDDKTLTRTMINNYTKNKLLPPPVKKRYSKEHIIILIYIYYLKNVISITDIQKLLYPMTERFFDKQEDSTETRSMTDIYESIYELEKSEYFNIESSTARAEEITEKLFPKEEDEYLHKMALIYLLGYDIYSKKRLIERLIDELPDIETPEDLKKKEKEAEKNKRKEQKEKKNAAKKKKQ